jgi:hypothetical protein
VAIRDYLTAPKIHSIDATHHQDRLGDTISILASDDFAVVAVHIVIRTTDGAIIEQGAATQNGGSLMRRSLDARLTGEVAERSIAGQIEFWAGLGRAVEPLLRADTALALKKRGEAMPLSACLKSVNTRAGRARLSAVLTARPFPHFEPAATPGLIVKVDADGHRTTGRFVNRKFRPVKSR